MGPFQRRAIRAAYYNGVIDATQMAAPSPGKTQGPSYSRQLDRARRQGWFDGRAKRALRSGEVLRRAEIREATR